ncbi:MAG: hypothetical protein ACTSR8_04770 [Promethearchaeota archaeon]
MHKNRNKTNKPDQILEWILAIAGLTLIGTAANTAYQVVYKTIISSFSVEIFFALFLY